MSRTVILSFGKGDLNNGFPEVTAQVWDANGSSQMRFRGGLLAKPEIFDCYNCWHSLYVGFYRNRSWRSRTVVDDDIELDDGGITNISVRDFDTISYELKENINDWLNSTSFFMINNQLRTELDTKEEIQFILETENEVLQKIPWHFWDFFEDYSQAEIALNTSDEYKRKAKIATTKKINKVKILVILGNSEGINTEDDKALIEKLEDTEPKFLVEPELGELNSSLWQQGWDILFFAGHSFTQEKGKICINNTDSLTIDKLKYGLKKAIERGLKLAIFNSCDGLGLARDLADLHIPQIIVMRELVPDQVAQTFLKHFLKAFSSGQSLYTSVRDAREQLQGEEKNFPCATWLPVICQNPAEVSPTWEELRDGVRRDSQVAIPVNIPSIEEIPEKDRVHPQPRGIWHRLQVVFCTSVVVTGLVMGVRSQGMLEALELPAYDQMMRMRGDEGQDKRLLIVTIDDADIKYQQEQKWNRRWSLSDEALDLLLKKLDKYEPRAIGLDVARLAGVDSDQADLAERLRKSDHFYASCYVRVPGDKHSGTPPPPEVPVERQGFSNVIADSDDVVRRHLVFMDTFPTSLCTAPGALSTELAIRYLKDEGIEPEFTSEKSLRLKQVVFKSLQVPDGGYQNPFGGSQIMLNYRTYNGSPLDFADTVTLTDVLSNKIKPETVKDRVVLIGVIASTTTSDRSRTPYQEEIPGVILHAQMVSQIISAALGERPLILVLPLWGEVLWVWGWSLIGGVLVLYFHSGVKLVITGGITLIILYSICYGLFTKGYWVSLLPPALAAIITSCSLIYLSSSTGFSKDNFTHKKL